MRRIVAAAVGLALGSGLLAACGSNSSGGGSSSSPTTIKIGYTAVGAGYADLYVGILDGIFKKNGLDVQLDNLDNSSLLVPSLLSGSIQIGVGVANNSAAAILKGQQLKFIALSEPVYNLQVWASKNITSVGDLVGKKVAVSGPGSESYFGLRALLAENGIPASKVSEVDVVNPQAQVASMESGAVDAILTQPPNGSQTAARGFHELTSLSNLPFALGTYTVTASYLASNSAVLKKFARAEIENLAFIRSNPTATIAAIEQDSGVSKPALAKQAYNFFLQVWAKDPTVSATPIKEAFAAAAKQSGVAAPADVSKYIDNSFVTSASGG